MNVLIKRLLILIVIVLGAAVSSGCDDMRNQAKYEPYEKSRLFSGPSSALHQVEGTVSQGDLEFDELLFQGTLDGEFADEYPFPITKEVLLRGEERFNMICANCHDRLGTGNGMVVQRGFIKPPTYHSQRLREKPAGYFFNVITKGFGRMFDYEHEIKAQDRWAIVAYIRALQFSHNAELSQLPKEDQVKFESQGVS